jgi:hypothetical protein
MKAEPILQAANGPIAQDANGVMRDADGNPVVYRQWYGIHEVKAVLRLNPVADKRSAAAIKGDQLKTAARSELEAAGEQTDLAIIAALTKDAVSPVPISVARPALMEWTRRIFGRHGHSRLGFASYFLCTWQLSRLIMAADVPQDTKEEWLHCYGDAFHRWHMEIFGEHASAYHGQHMAANRPKGPAARKAKADNRRAIIVREVLDVIDDDTASCPYIAGRFKSINLALKVAGERQFATPSALSKALQIIRRERRKDRLANQSRA